MTQRVHEVMTKDPIKLRSSSTVVEAARRMRDAAIGAVVVEDDGGRICGIVTDRDIAIRTVAAERDPKTTKLSDVCSKSLAMLSADEQVDRAVEIMREKAVRRVPVVDTQNNVVGIVSIGDLAQLRDPASALGQISAAPPNR